MFQFYCLSNNTFYDISPSSKEFSLMSHITFSCSISLAFLNLEHFNNISLYGIANFKEYSLCAYCFFFSTETSSFYTFDIFFRDFLVVTHFLLESCAHRCNQHLKAHGAPLCRKEGVPLGYLIEVLSNYFIS